MSYGSGLTAQEESESLHYVLNITVNSVVRTGNGPDQRRVDEVTRIAVSAKTLGIAYDKAMRLLRAEIDSDPHLMKEM